MDARIDIDAAGPARIDPGTCLPASPGSSGGDLGHGLMRTLRGAFASGRTQPLRWRRAQLDRLADLLADRESDLEEALVADLGRCPLEAWFELGLLARQLRYVRRHLGRWAKPERVRTPLLTLPGSSRIVREPLGVVLVIAPWNAPVMLTLGPLIGAIAAGNCAVVKPSEIAPHTSKALARWLPRYLDPQCFAVVEGDAQTTVALLEKRFDHVLFTGGNQVARVVLEAAARHLTPVTLELGGKCPCIVAHDADIEVAARRITWGKFINAGQICVAPDHVLVDSSLADKLTQGLVRSITAFYGVDPRESPDYQRIVNRFHWDRVVRFLDEGEVITGGEYEADALYIAPTVLTNVSPEALAMQEEIFGPVLPVVPVPDLDAAIERVRARPKPLALYLFTRSGSIRRRVVQSTSSGGVCVNDVFIQLAVEGLPFGGVGASGMGAYQGRSSFETFSHRKAVLNRANRPDLSVRYPPYGPRKLGWLRRLV